MCKLITCAKCCTIFSAIGFAFLIVIGILLERQPLYVKGITNSKAGSAGCFSGAGIYAATFAVSILYWGFDEVRQGNNPFSSSKRNQTGRLSEKGGATYGAVEKS